MTTPNAPYWPPAVKPRRRWLAPTLAALVVALAGALVAILLTRPDAGTPPTTPVAQTTTEALEPVTPPTGARGAEWHALYGDEPWAAHILGVDTIGQLLIVGTDLGTGSADLDTAVEICRLGREHVTRVGVPDATVAVYGPPGNLKLAESRGGRPCAVTV